MKKPLIIGIIVLLVIIGAGYVAMNWNTLYPSTTPSSQDSASQPPASSSGSSGDQQVAATITYSDNGFSPSTLTVKSGDTLAIKNTSSGDMQFDSNPHPAHTDDSDLNVGLVSAGQTKTFTVTKAGTFNFHNHFNSSHTAKITIQ